MTAHVLFVDDDQSVLDAYQRNLKSQYHLTIIDCPQKALKIIQEEPVFDVVVSDIRMPHMDGIAFLRKVRDFLPSAKRILLSGYANAEMAMRAVNECMAFRYLTKPTSAEALSIVIEEALKEQDESRQPHSDVNMLPKDRILLADFDAAIQDDSLELYYQPKVDLNNALVSSAEALLRWHHPKYGQISPAHIIPLVEQSGRSDVLAEWVLKTACTQASHWDQHDHTVLKIAVNLSPANFTKQGMAEKVKKILAETNCRPDLLELEVTESLQLPTESWIWTELNMLNDWGITLSVDDFGAGYSSFEHLSRLPVSQLKLDCTLIENIISDSRNKKIVNLLIGLSHSLNLGVVAEGIETQAQADFLQNIGCDYGQGYLYSQALNADAFLKWVQYHNQPQADKLISA